MASDLFSEIVLLTEKEILLKTIEAIVLVRTLITERLQYRELILSNENFKYSSSVISNVEEHYGVLGFNVDRGVQIGNDVIEKTLIIRW